MGRTVKGEVAKWINDFLSRPHNLDPASDCIIWPFGLSNGRAIIRHKGKVMHTARLVCEKVHGDPPSKYHEAAHSCGRGDEACIAPAHVLWKTHADNCYDRVAHGTAPKGKLTEQQVRRIRALTVNRDATIRQVALEHGVHHSTIHAIVAGKRRTGFRGA